jgi:light-regulated signal transduction histidine kinase (bacteriophytochrome)
MTEHPSEPTLAELVAVMAHDLNNPLAALVTNLSFIEGALGPAPSGEVGDALGDAIMLCDVLRRLSRNLDLIARREGVSSGVTVADLGQLTREAVGRLQTQAAAAELLLLLDPVPASGEAMVRCDRELMVRALDNLLAYAMEQAPSRSRVAVTAARGEGGVRVVVEHSRRPSGRRRRRRLCRAGSAGGACRRSTAGARRFCACASRSGSWVAGWRSRPRAGRSLVFACRRLLVDAKQDPPAS